MRRALSVIVCAALIVTLLSVSPPKAQAVFALDDAAVVAVVIVVLAASGLMLYQSGYANNAEYTRAMKGLLTDYLFVNYPSMTLLQWIGESGIALARGKIEVLPSVAQRIWTFGQWLIREHSIPVSGEPLVIKQSRIVPDGVDWPVSYDGSAIVPSVVPDVVATWYGSKSDGTDGVSLGDDISFGYTFKVSDLFDKLNAAWDGTSLHTDFSYTWPGGDTFNIYIRKGISDSLYASMQHKSGNVFDLNQNGYVKFNGSRQPFVSGYLADSSYVIPWVTSEHWGIGYYMRKLLDDGTYKDYWWNLRSNNNTEFFRSNVYLYGVDTPQIMETSISGVGEMVIPEYDAESDVLVFDPAIAVSSGTDLTVDDILSKGLANGLTVTVTTEDIADSAIGTGETVVEPVEIGDYQSLGAILTSRFPFSIPWDFARGIKLLSAPAKTPYFEVDFFEPISDLVGGWKGSTKLVLDFSEYEIIGQISRWTSTIGFCLFLAFSTKKLIWK